MNHETRPETLPDRKFSLEKEGGLSDSTSRRKSGFRKVLLERTWFRGYSLQRLLYCAFVGFLHEIANRVLDKVSTRHGRVNTQFPEPPGRHRSEDRRVGKE